MGWIRGFVLLKGREDPLFKALELMERSLKE